MEVSTAEARTKEIMLILDEREREAAELRRVLAAKETARQVWCHDREKMARISC